MKGLISHTEDYGLDSVSNEVLLKSFIIHSGLNVERTDSNKSVPEARDKTGKSVLSFELIVPHDRVSVNHL